MIKISHLGYKIPKPPVSIIILYLLIFSHWTFGLCSLFLRLVESSLLRDIFGYGLVLDLMELALGIFYLILWAIGFIIFGEGFKSTFPD